MADTWTFFGRVHPERVPINWGTPLQGTVKQPLTGVALKFRTIVHASQIIVDLTPIEGVPDVEHLKNMAVQCATAITDLVGYTSGCSFAVEIVSAINRSNDEWRVFGIEIPVLVARDNPLRANNIDGKLLSQIAASPIATMVLADFQSAMRDPIGTGFYCYRAVEAMMQSMKKAPEEKSNKAFPRLREYLRIEEPVLRLIEKHASYPRHGRPSGMSNEERAHVFELTDEIIRRYLEYLARGSWQLPEGEFDVLKA